MGAPTLLADFLGRPEDVRQMTGICLAIGGNLLVSVALNLTKHAHNMNQRSAFPKPYVQLSLWWLGFIATIVGEMGNFAAYGFAPASLIAPLGAVSVLSNAFIAALVLREGFRLRDLVGCALCIGGALVIVLASASHPADPDIKGLLYRVQDNVFIGYMACLSLLTALMLGFQDQYGDMHVSYYVLLCSMIGSVTVLACKGVSTMLNMWVCCGGAVPFGQPVLYVLLFVLVATAVLQVERHAAAARTLLQSPAGLKKEARDRGSCRQASEGGMPAASKAGGKGGGGQVCTFGPALAELSIRLARVSLSPHPIPTPVLPVRRSRSGISTSPWRTSGIRRQSLCFTSSSRSAPSSHPTFCTATSSSNPPARSQPSAPGAA